MDQHVVTDWRAYFEALGPKGPMSGPDKTPMYEGPAMPRVVYVCGPVAAPSTELVVVTEEDLFDKAKAIYEDNSGPEMWVFSHLGGPPWHVNAKPAVKKGKGQ